MTFTYDASSPTGNIEKVRLMIGDTDSTNPIFDDDELDLWTDGDVFVWAGNLMMAIANTAAKIAIVCSISNRDFVIDRKQVAKECRESAAKLFKLAETIPYATEGMLEDEEQTFIKSIQDNEYDYDIDDTDLNT